MRKSRRVLFICIVVFAAPLFSGCPPVPAPVGVGDLGCAKLDASNRLHMVVTDEEGLKYGVLRNLSISSELVDSGFPHGQFGFYYYPRGSLALAPGEAPHITYSSNGEMIHAWKESGGWQSEQVAPMDGFGSIDVDHLGDIHIAIATGGFFADTINIHYALGHDGTWNTELVETIDTSDGSYWAMPQIRLQPDQTPVIAYAIGSVNLGMGTRNGFLSVRIAQKGTGGGWEIGEVFLSHPTYPEESGVDLYDMSFSMSPSGEMAVGLTYEMVSGDPYAWYRYYHIMVNAGDGWQEPFSDVSYAGSGNQDFKGQDIAHDSQGNLYALFTREDLGAPPDYSYEESIRLARWTGTGWDEKTLWDNSLYGARMGVPYYPALLMSSASVANIAYNGSTGIWFFARP